MRLLLCAVTVCLLLLCAEAVRVMLASALNTRLLWFVPRALLVCLVCLLQLHICCASVCCGCSPTAVCFGCSPAALFVVAVHVMPMFTVVARVLQRRKHAATVGYGCAPTPAWYLVVCMALSSMAAHLLPAAAGVQPYSAAACCSSERGWCCLLAYRGCALPAACRLHAADT
jgi:hypothetical protein